MDSLTNQWEGGEEEKKEYDTQEEGNLLVLDESQEFEDE